MNINIPLCEDPQIIINPRAVYLIQHHGAVVRFRNINGCFSGLNINKLPVKRMLREAYRITEGHNYDLLEPYIVSVSGFPAELLFMLVPCNKCDLCGYRKQVDKVMRAQMDESMFTVPPVWFTLTYKPSCLPPSGELRYKDVQDFFKRLRRKLDRMHLPTDFRYLVSGEYGKKGRPHYHVIMYNNPFRADETQARKFADLRKLIFDTWARSEPQAFDFGQCYGCASAYVTKYLTKSFRDDKHLVKPFVHTSIMNGGLGRPLLMSKKDFYRLHPTQRNFTYRDSTGNIREINFSSYMDNVLFPSASRCVPSEQKLLYREYIYSLQQAVKVGLLTDQMAYDLAEKYRPYKNAVRNTYVAPELGSACTEYFIEDEDYFYDPSAFVSRVCPNMVGNILSVLEELQQNLHYDCLVGDDLIENYQKFHDAHQFEKETFEQKVNKAHKAKKQKAVAQFNEKL